MTTCAEPVGTFEPNTPEWYAARANGLGGSEIAAVLGLSPWTSRFTLWHRKAGNVPEEADNAGMSWGRRLEPVIADVFAEGHPEFGVLTSGTWRSRARPWQIANPDRLLTDPLVVGARVGPHSLLEVKTAHSMDGWKWGPSGTDEVPVYYRCQGMWYLDVFGFQRCCFAVLIGGSDYREFVIEYDEAEARMMRDEGERFLQSVVAGDQPDLDSSDSTYDTVRQLHPEIVSTEIALPDKFGADYRWVCENHKQAVELKQAFTIKVLDIMGNAQYATHDGRRIAQRISKQGRTPYLKYIPATEAA